MIALIRRIILILLLSTTLACVYRFAYACDNVYCAHPMHKSKDVIATELWSKDFKDRIFDAFPFVINDVNHDGNPEIVLMMKRRINGNYSVIIYILNAQNGNILFNVSLPIGGRPWVSTKGDLNNDGYIDFIVETYKYAYVINGKNFSLSFIIKMPIEATVIQDLDLSITEDIDNDGFRDILFVLSDQFNRIADILICSGKDGHKITEVFINNTLYVMRTILYDWNNDGILDIIFFTFEGTLGVFSIDGDLILTKKLGEFKAPLVSPLLDINHNNIPDVIIASEETCMAFELSTGKILWKINLPYKSQYASYSPLSIGDINSDGKLDAILLAPRFLCIVSLDGELIYHSKLPVECSNIYRCAAIGDIDGDNRDEALLMLGEPDVFERGLYVFDWDIRNVTFTGIRIEDDDAYSPPILADIDDDSNLEAIICEWEALPPEIISRVTAVDFPNAGWRCDFPSLPIDSRGNLNYTLIDPDLDCLSNYSENLAGTNPHDNDTDDDGTPDGWEVSWGFNPLSNDSHLDYDNDGLSNLNEFIHGTCPISWDSDGDGFSDGEEVSWGCNPLDPEDNPHKRILYISSVIAVATTSIVIVFYFYRRSSKI